MSNLATRERLRQSTSQLPVSWYNDPALLELERTVLFDRGPGYVGHELMVPEHGRLSRARLARQRAGAGPQRRRRGAAVQRLPPPPGHHADRARHDAEHRLPDPSLDLPARRQAAGRAAFRGATVRRSCTARRCSSWNGLLFDGARDIRADLAGMRAAPDLDFSGYVLDRVEIQECNYNWKTFIEVYLEDYHVEPFHPGSRAVRHLRRPGVAVRRPLLAADRRRQQRSRQAGHQGLRALAQGGARATTTARPRARRDLADHLSQHHGRVVPARAHGQHA